VFSTTSTWNMRGRQMKAAAETSVSAIQRSPCISQPAMGDSSMAAIICTGPPATPQTTNTPTQTSATSFTTASTAMAMTTPLCFSSTSRLRVPKMMVNSASPAATQTAVGSSEPAIAPVALSGAKVRKASVTDWSCSAM
jgi:hypothetical protein